jgi:hypothetical protein
MTVAVTSHNSENKHIPYTLKNTLFNSITFPIMNAMTKPGVKTFDFPGAIITAAWIIYSSTNRHSIDRAIDEDEFRDLKIKTFQVTDSRGRERIHLHTMHIDSDGQSLLTLALIRRIKSYILKSEAEALTNESKLLLSKTKLLRKKVSNSSMSFNPWGEILS